MKYLPLSRWTSMASGSGGGRASLRAGGQALAVPRGQAGLAGVGRIDEEVRLLDEPAALVGVEPRRARLVAEEEELRELPAREAVPEEPGVEEALPELLHHPRRVLPHVQVLRADQRAGGHEHGLVGAAVGSVEVARLQREAGLERLRLRLGDLHLEERDHLAGALA